MSNTTQEQHGLDKFYGLRRDFIIIGLTGWMQAGADKFVKTRQKPPILLVFKLKVAFI